MCMEGKERLKKEQATHSRLVGGRFNKQGKKTYIGGLSWVAKRQVDNHNRQNCKFR